MAYFPHAFEKMLVGTTGFEKVAGVKTITLQAGEIGVIDAKANTAINITAAASYPTNPVVYLAQGSFHTSDKLGSSFHGGYKETIKTKGINPKYVSKFYVVAPADPVASVVSIDVKDCTAITCDTTYYLRVDVKGSPALRFLTHNLYNTFDAKTPCCPAGVTNPDNLDPAYVLLGWKDQINAHPFFKNFVQAEVFSATTASVAINPTAGSATIVVSNANAANFQAGELVVHASLAANSRVVSVGAADSAGAGNTNVVLSKAAVSSTDGNAVIYSAIASDTFTFETGANADTHDYKLILTAAYADTVFGDCSFQPDDFYEKEPLYIYPSFVDDSGNPCNVSCFVSSELVTGKQGNGFGETLVRELILFKRYLQEPWQQDLRMREVENVTTLTDLSRSSKYFTYHILHSIPRKSNPSGMLDSDQYLVKIVVSARDTDFETWFNAYLVSAGNDEVALEVF